MTHSEFRFPVDSAAVEQAIATARDKDELVAALVKMMGDRDLAIEHFLSRLLGGNTEDITTTGGGRATITHGLPFTPTTVVCTPGAPDGPFPVFSQAILTAITSTTFVVRCIDQAGNVLVNAGPFALNWIAYGPAPA
jgi:hypothetical protein